MITPAANMLSLFDFADFSATHIVSTPTPAPGPLVVPTTITAPVTTGIGPIGHLLLADRDLAKTWHGRAVDNLAAIRMMQKLTARKRPATAEEMEILAKFVGFGASELATALFPLPGHPVKTSWATVHAELNSLLSTSEIASLARSTQYAHYTPEFVGRALWKAAVGLGFIGGEVLEPGCGTGLILSLTPQTLPHPVRVTGVEMDPITAQIAQLLQPNARILQDDFTKTCLPNVYSLALGNPPYSQTKTMGVGKCASLSLRLHDYFLARSLELLQPNGIAAFVTSRGTMDKLSTEAREYMGSLANLIGAIRLPQKALDATAGTEVVVDLLFFRRRSTSDVSNLDAWKDVAEIHVPGSPSTLSINTYFTEHPEYVLGNHAVVSSPFGPKYSCVTPSLADLNTRLDTAIDAIVAAEPAIHATVFHFDEAADVDFPPRGLKEGSYYIRDGQIRQIVNARGELVPIRGKGKPTGIFSTQAKVIHHFVAVRDALRATLRAQESDLPYATAQANLETAYAAYVAALGPINFAKTTVNVDDDGIESRTVRRPNISAVQDDPDCWLVASIERYDEETGIASRGPIFTERVLRPLPKVTIQTIDDALASSLDTFGRADIDHIAQLMGVDRSAAITQLDQRVFLVPHTQDEWQTADEYLSGNVRRKLREATLAADVDSTYQRNVDALSQAQPIDLTPSEVTVRLGAPWVPTSDIVDFCNEVIDVKTTIGHNETLATWDVDQDAFRWRPQATSLWGTGRRHAGNLLHDALNNRIPQIYDTIDKKQVLNAVDTEAAKEKLKKIQNAFTAWVWTDFERTQRLIRIYNDRYNDIVPRTFDGSHLQLPGTAGTFRFYNHQRRVIWRIISAGATYIAHTVGAGKTFSIAAAVFEQKRLGLVTKPLLVVPRHCLAQASREFMQLYPNANILVADEANFAKDKRHLFMARATTAQWDCIIVTDSAFRLLPSPTDFEQEYLQTELARIEEIATDKSLGRTTRKRIEQLKEAFAKRLDALTERQDDMVTISEMGIDQIIVDEAQNFRKLAFMTNATTIKGIDPTGSQRAWDLYIKSLYMKSINPKRGLIMASGTPITNTMGEMFTLQRFLGAQDLVDRGLHEFDGWSAQFGETVTELELQPSGQYKAVSRFAQFVNVPELVAMFRSFADVVSKQDLRTQIKLPSIKTGRRCLVTAPASADFKSYQKALAQRIAKIEQRTRGVQKGDDIILSVITDGRHAAIDMRLVDHTLDNDETSKLNACIRNVYRIWADTASNTYHLSDGSVSPTPGAVQMIFSDLGTPAVASHRGFSAYTWIREELLARGIPAREIAFMQDYQKTSDKQALFNQVNAGTVRILIGSSETMGTGVNVQRRLKALHHLDVPWIPSLIEQREGRIERQGNENEEIEIYAYATLGSMDAPMWQTNQRKAEFIGLALSGNKGIRRLEDATSQASQFAEAKAIASGNPLLIQKAGLESEIARLRRLELAHRDDQHALGQSIYINQHKADSYETTIPLLKRDIRNYVSTRGDAFVMTLGLRTFTQRKAAGAALLEAIELAKLTDTDQRGTLGGFTLRIPGTKYLSKSDRVPDIIVEFAHERKGIELDKTPSDVGLITRLENTLANLDSTLDRMENDLYTSLDKVRQAKRLYGKSFEFTDELNEKRNELSIVEDALIAESKALEAERIAAEELLNPTPSPATIPSVDDDLVDPALAAEAA